MTSDDDNNNNNRRGELEALLPWHATGRLSPRDARRVEEALARDPELARRFALVLEEREETVALNEALGAPSAAARARLLARIAAAPARRAGRGRSLSALLDRLAAALSPRGLAIAGAALGVLALVQAGALTALLVSGGGERYTTASGPGTLGPGEGASALVAFAPQATAAQIEALLARHRAVIVDGPRPGGLFRLRLGERRLSTEERERALAALRAETAIRLALPAE